MPPPGPALADELAHLHRTVRRQGLSAADADDLVQEVCLVMCRRWADYDPGRPLRPWLLGIAFRLLHKFRVRSARELPRGLVDGADQTPTPEQVLTSLRAHRLVTRALADLPVRQRALIVMADLEEKPLRDVAHALSVRRFALYARLRLARRALARACRRRQAGLPTPPAGGDQDGGGSSRRNSSA
jgi:RNA polymerase sigma-70 factor (ECF subfamily)